MNNFLNSSSIAVIGGADGPTAVFVSDNGGFGILVTVAVVIIAAVSIALIFKKRKK